MAKTEQPKCANCGEIQVRSHWRTSYSGGRGAWSCNPIPPADVPAATPIQTERRKYERRMWTVLNEIRDIAGESKNKRLLDLVNDAGCLLAGMEIIDD